jgi:hypothetical protein
MYLCKASYSQETYFQISNTDTAYSGIDVVYEDGFHILGNAWDFNPPYSGIPIEGEYSFGNVYFFINKNGQMEYKSYFNNNELAPSFEGLGRVPGGFFFSLGNESINLPFTKHYGIVQCANPMLAMNTYRLGIANIEKNGSEYYVRDTVFNQFGLCENLAPIGFLQDDDSYLLILKDNVYTESMTFKRFDFLNNLTAEYQKEFFSFEVKVESITVDENNNPILLGWNSNDDYNMSLLKTNQKGDSLFQFNINSSTHPFTPVAITGGQGGDLLIAAYRYNMDYSEIEHFLLCFDDGLNEKWRVGFPFNIRAITAIDEGQGYLVASVPTSGQPSPFNISFLNSEGELISSEEYGEENDIPEKVKILNDSLFAVIGTNFIGYQNSTIGNPYASIFISVDTVQKLTISNVKGASGDDFKIEAYPNPTRGELNISFARNSGARPHLIEIHGLEGSKLGYQYLDPTTKNATLDLNYLPCGTYIGIIYFESGGTKLFKISIRHP